jgi:hypothetical protein
MMMVLVFRVAEDEPTSSFFPTGLRLTSLILHDGGEKGRAETPDLLPSFESGSSVRWVRGSEPQPAWFGSNDRSGLQFRAVFPDRVKADNRLLTSSDVDQSYDAAVRRATNDSQFTEVFVQGDKDPTFRMSAS